MNRQSIINGSLNTFLGASNHESFIARSCANVNIMIGATDIELEGCHQHSSPSLRKLRNVVVKFLKEKRRLSPVSL